MATTKFIPDALWLSYSSISHFQKCPQAYYLKNIYRDKATGYKLQVASPYLTLGGVVHSTIDWFLKQADKPSLDEVVAKYKNLWLKYRGKKGGFTSREEEAEFGKRGILMLDNFIKNFNKLEEVVPPLNFPKYYFDEDKMVLTGNIDFVGQLQDKTLHLIDFKTGTNDEKSILQLNIYTILATENYGQKVSKISYWYLDRDDSPKEAQLDLPENIIEMVRRVGLEMKEAVKKNDWQCIKGEELCNNCRDYLAVISGKGEYLFDDMAFKKKVYFLKRDL